MARAAPPITLVALIAACLVLALALVAPAAGARHAGANQRNSPTGKPARRRAPAAKPARRHVRRCSPAGIRRLRGTSRIERRVRCLVNKRRAAARLRPLRYDLCLDRAAERHARDMVRRHYFAHTSRAGRDLAQRVRAAGYVKRARGWRLGENLAWGSGGGSSARSIVSGWMRSAPHRANILTGGFRDIGVAVVRGAPVEGRSASSRPATFVVEFGARQPGRCRR
ncbi:CAP domain-containing protein [Conexibacter sp. CPCC 206217]|uniref:CAP domain-containing protein n=1 Tax=Conexibacter sp. CPCC 206217 TaxID=3064574 RepID=UPI00271DC474|nr:CAP domain-containing protein [Conexibacter sp. CPCC 206217]MDO8210932.1 CAP domain-containing protein [Conexibacter sp. CPCC 206217]